MDLTEFQEDTLLAAAYCIGRLFIDTTSEITMYDNHGIEQLARGKSSGTGRRLAALEKKGLIKRVGVWRGSPGARWEMTRAGYDKAHALEREGRS